MVIWPFGCNVTLLIVVAGCCFAIHCTSALVTKTHHLIAANGYLQVTAREKAAQLGNKTHGQPRVTAFHPSVQKGSDHPVDEDVGVLMPVHVC